MSQKPNGGDNLPGGPLFFDDSGDVLVLRTVEAAQRYLEAVDVVDQVYSGFDSEGRSLHLGAPRPNRVSITLAEDRPTHADTLRRILLDFLRRTDAEAQRYEQASLQEVVQVMLKHVIS